MRLVNGKERYVDVAKQIGHLEQQTLGRDIQKLDVSAQTCLPYLDVLGVVKVAVQRGRRNAVGKQRVYLVFHQGYEGRDDHGCAAHQQSRKLVAY